MPPGVRRMVDGVGLRALAAAALAAALPGPVTALPPHLPIRALVRDTYRDRDGLPQNAIRALLHSASGALWIATDEGLARFDGAQMTQVGRREEPGLTSDIITALAETPDGTLWVGTYDGGLVRRTGGGRFEPFAIPGAPAGLRIASLSVDRAGGLWVGSSAGAFHVGGARAEAYSMANGLPDDRVNDVKVDGGGVVWVAHRRGLVRVVGGQVVPGPRELDGVSTHAIHPDPAGGVWVGTIGRGVARVGPAGVKLYGSAQGLPSDTATSIELDRDGSVWVGTQTSGLARLRDGKVERFRARDGLPGDWISALLEDREGSLWVGTQDAGLVRLRQADFQTYGAAEGLSHDAVEALLQTRGGDVVLATDGGVDLLPGGALPARRIMEGHPLSLMEDRSGALWIGTIGEGLWRRRGGQAVRVDHGLPATTWFRAIVEDQDGTVWAGTTEGLYRVHGDRLAPVGDGLPPERPAVVAVAPAPGGLFVATEGSGVFRRGGGRFVREDGGPPDTWVVSAFLVDPDGTIWMSTEGGGLWRRRGGAYAHVTMAQGLHADTLWTLLDDRRGGIWASSNRGIFRMARADLEAALDGRAARLTARVWAMDDGLRCQEAAGLSHPGGWRAADGRLWFATLRGASVVDPARLRPDPPPPPTSLQRVTVAGLPRPLTLPVSLADGAGRLELEFDADLLLGQKQVSYRYRLAGFEAGWSEAPGGRTAQYTSLPAGSYRFEVQGRVGEGAWGPPASLEVVQAPPAWRTPRALAAAAAALAVAAAVLAWAARRWSARRRRAAEEALRAASAEVAALSALLPRCGWCREERRDPAYLAAVDEAMRARPAAQFDGGLCPACAARHRTDGGPDGGSATAR